MADPQAQQTVPIFGPDGQVRDIPRESMGDALKNGGELAHAIINPKSGQSVWVPQSQLGAALQNGGVPEGAMMPRRPMNQGSPSILQQIDSGVTAVGSALNSAAASGLGLRGMFNPAVNAQRVAGAIQGVQNQPTTGSKIAAAAAPFVNVDANAVQQVAIHAGTTGDYGPLVASGVLPLATAHLATSKVGPQVNVKDVITQLADQELTDRRAGQILNPKAVLGDSVKPLDQLTGTTPERIQELQQFPSKVDAIRNTVVQAEKAAHNKASAAFPQFNEPIKIGENVTETGLVDENGKPLTKTEDVTTTFKDLQEQRSNLLQDIAQEKRAVAAGNAPRFDLARMYEKLSNLDDTMSQAAVDQGGPEGLAKLQAARQQYGQYMNDFHSSGSPLKKLLDAKEGETQKIVNHLLSSDNGARTVETLGRNGADVSAIQDLLSQGDRPLRVSVAESAKLRKAGSPQAYKLQRLRESLRQATVNELPSSAQERLPQGAMRNQAPGALKQVPILDRITPRTITAARLRRALNGKQ